MSDASATNPVSTGGGGTFFEQHVDALFLALLLVRAPLPILKKCQVEEVHFQAEHLGWHTDDVLVVGVRPDGRRRRLAAQVKRRFTISDKDETCVKAINDFYADFTGDEFDSATDRLALICLRGTNVLLDGFGSLLDCARASSDAADFTRRLEVDGFLSKTARGHAAAIRRILTATNEQLTDEQFWRLLSVLHLLSFDLNTSSAQNEAWVKVLLAASANDGDPLTSAEISWNELLELVGAGVPTAASYSYEKLPENLRERHGPIDTRSNGVVRALYDHSSVTLGGIKATIGDAVEIDRTSLTSQVLDALSEHQVVLVAAPAGFGKSAVAKSCLALLDRDHYCLAFRAEEFCVPHIDQTLLQAQVDVNGADLLGILAGQGRKLVLIESVERLLESSVRDAFANLLNLARQDRSLGLLITCRDYSLDTVSSALLGPAGLAYNVVEVPPLSDNELQQATEAVPHLANALKHEELKRLLRSPYLLDKASQMDWADEEGLPKNEREFRRRCWREVVRDNATTANGLPDRREQAFLNVALRRARELRPFVGIEGLDAGAVESLRNDGLIVESPESSSMAAPGHDVLEDWAIIQWLAHRWFLHERAAGPLAQDVGGYPAIRRSYRRWLSELLREDTAQATDFVLSVFQDATLPSCFRDDTLVCTLQSSSARQFLERHRDVLLEDHGRLLVRVIHLLRVACKTVPRWLRGVTQAPSQMLVASGEAWPAVLQLVLEGIDQLLPVQMPTILGLIEDVAGSIDSRNPEPNGFEEAAKIGFALLPHLDGYRMDDMRKQTLKVIAKVPRGDEKAFRELVERAIANERQGRLADQVSEILLGGIDGWNACRYFPAELIRLANSRFLLHEEDFQTDRWRYGSSIEIGPYFGMREHTQHDCFPASAIRGVFYPLLQHHPREGLSFIIELLNHAGGWYGEQRLPKDPLEPAHQVTIELPGENAVTQWANPRLWGLYRGHQVGPYVIQTALMALEKWLLEICKLDGVDVEPWLLKILRESNNVMATAAVASACNAHPEKAGRAGLALLSSRELIWMDRARMGQERANTAMIGFLPSFGVDEIFEIERKESDALGHRNHDLEGLAIKLQLLKGREDVFALIDKHREALPPAEEQSEAHRLWRLALHRMDVRGFRAVEEPSAAGIEGKIVDAPEGEEKQEQRVYLGPGEMEPDVQELVNQHAPIAAQQNQDISLQNWGNATWEGREAAHLDLSDWKTFLARARSRDADPEPDDFLRSGPGLIAAVCARDRWGAMNVEDRDWCIDKMVREVERDCDAEDDTVRRGRGALSPDRHAAYVLPSLLARGLNGAQAALVKSAIAKSLTHAVEEVVTYAAEGIGASESDELEAFPEACVAAMAWQARLTSVRLDEERAKPPGERVLGADLVREIAPTIRAGIIAGDRDPEKELWDLDVDDWPGTRAVQTILPILGSAPNSALAIAFHRQIASAIAEEWNQEQRDRGRSGIRDLQFCHEFLRRLARFALRLEREQALRVCESMLAAVARHPKEVKDFVLELVIAADRSTEADSFWDVWQAFADTIGGSPWFEHLDSRNYSGKEFVRNIFLDVDWKENVRHWRRLEGQGHRIDELASKFSGSAAVFDAYCRFLFKIGESSLPGAYVLLADSLATGEPTEMLADRNTVYLLEALLRRQVCAEPHRLKSDPGVRTAVLALLDHLVDAGSSAAYRMRDDFVTPPSRPDEG